MVVASVWKGSSPISFLKILEDLFPRKRIVCGKKKKKGEGGKQPPWVGQEGITGLSFTKKGRTIYKSKRKAGLEGSATRLKKKGRATREREIGGRCIGDDEQTLGGRTPRNKKKEACDPREGRGGGFTFSSAQGHS